MTDISPLVDTQWLSENLDDENIVVLDCSWHLPTSDRDGKKEFAMTHIPGARFFDIDDICDKLSPLPHMLPDDWTFSEKVTSLGIRNDNHIICYDVLGLFSAARVWWMFRAYGHDKVSVLDGGFKKWKAEGRPTNNIKKPIEVEGRFLSELNKDMVVTYEQILTHTKEKDVNILDARSKGRFSAQDPEPRKDLPSGHMPGSTCIPFNWLLQPNGSLKSVEEMETIFENGGFDKDKPVITTCGSGVTASVLIFALYLIGIKNARLYDGSWSEYASKSTSRILQY